MDEKSKSRPVKSDALPEEVMVKLVRHLMECGCDADGRILVVCIDGTSNQFGAKNTNVIELYNLIRKEEEHNQLTWYNSGIGTYAPPSWKSISYLKQVLYHKVDLAIAWDFERTVLGAYRWLSENYKPRDRIFLFGFSRGAFQVRVLSAMIHKVGLIYKGNEMQIPFAYALYADPKSDLPTVAEVGEPGEEPETVSMAERFKRAFSRPDVKVHFVGAWDTVSSIGVARGKKLLPHTVEGMKHVCYFRHALALDERRVKFLPEYAYGGRATISMSPGNDAKKPNPRKKADNSESGGTNDESAAQEKRPQVKEVWFAGTHSDIGGGNVQNTGMNRSRPPLRWMVFEAEAVGLRTKGFKTELSPKKLIEIKESLTWMWRPLEILPLSRLTFSRDKEDDSTTRKPHLGRSRKIHEGQKIHLSLVLADTEKMEYIPKAHPPKPSQRREFWRNLAQEDFNHWLEFDVDVFIEGKLQGFITSSGQDRAKLQDIEDTLKYLPSWIGRGRQTLYDKVIRVLGGDKPDDDAKLRLLEFTLTYLKKTSSQGPLLNLQEWPRVNAVLKPIQPRAAETNRGEIVKEFRRDFTDRCVSTIKGDYSSVEAVAFSPDGIYIAFASDNAIRLWNVETGEAEGPVLQGHTEWVCSVAFSPDGNRIVSGSVDETIRLWDVKTGKQIGKPLEGLTDWAWSIAFSPDGSRIASGSSDKTVRLWDAATGEAIEPPMEGHNGLVSSVAFSADGRYLASGSLDYTIRLLDARSGQPVGEPFRGDTGAVLSVAFSPDGKRLASGSMDMTIRLWDLETRKQDGRAFAGHADFVRSIAFSPDGRRIVSCSDDMTVRLWNVETREEEGPPLRGHTDLVWSAVFSPDGKRVVSGSHDGTIRIWDVEVYRNVFFPK